MLMLYSTLLTMWPAMKEMLLPIMMMLITGTSNIYVASSPGFVVSINDDSSYSLLINGLTWLVSGDTAFISQGKEYSLSDKSLKVLNSSTATGNDIFGPWTSTSFTYQAGDLPVMATFKSYTDQETPAIIFSQRYLGDATQTSADDKDQVISQFPSFKMAAPREVKLGFVAYAGYHTGWTSLQWGEFSSTASLTTGIQYGPLLLFDNTTNAIVISPLTQFMAVSDAKNKQKDISWGIMGLVDHVPKDFSVDFIIYYSNRGINEAMRGWGRHLKRFYNWSPVKIERDPTVNYLGYWTDNGAYYYYNMEISKNYEDTIIDVHKHMANLSIPFRYIQYDSWWYPKGHIGGCTTWTMLPDIFPDGFKYVSDQTKLSFGCHNRFWDNETSYARYNGGKYNFISDTTTGYAVPDDDQFWIDLFNTTRSWGQFILYEQDWLDRETEKVYALESDVFLGRRWLVSMGRAAEAFGITIQYCSASTRHLMQALEIPAVTQTRVSRDYGPGGAQWRIGKTAMYSDAIGLAAFKDTFWSTTNQPGNPYKNATEPYTQLNALVSTLSAGPVGPGDGIGFFNKTLLMRCCDATGLILKPSKPIMSIDDNIKRAAFQSLSYAGPEGELYTTYSDISGFMFGIILAAEMNNSYDLKPSAGWTNVQLPASLVFSSLDPRKLTPVTFSESSPLKLGRECTIQSFCLFHTSPIIELDSGNKVILMGELDKWVPMSAKRFTFIQKRTDDIHVHLTVQANEKVVFTFYLQNTGSVQEIVCDNSQSSVPADGTVISIVNKLCTVRK